MATLLRKGRLSLFAETRPGPKGSRKATGTLRAQALELRAAGQSVTEIAAALTSEGMLVSAQIAWQIRDGEGLPRLPRRDEGHRGSPTRLDPVKAAALPGWTAGPASLPCDHAGLLLLLPAMTQIGLPDLTARPATPPPGTCQRGSRSARCCWPSAPASPASPTPGRWPTTPGWRSLSG